MAIETTYQSESYKPGEGERFVRLSYGPEGYAWCVRDPKSGLDVAQGVCRAHDLPADVRAVADAAGHTAFNYVAWP